MNLQLLEKLADKRIAIIGDICLDCYYHLGDMSSETSVETGLPANAVESFSFSLGGAANVALNCKSLGAGTVDLFGVVGEDAFGSILKTMLEEGGVGGKGIVTQPNNWDTNVYHKIYIKDIEQPRFDVGLKNEVQNEIIDTLLERFKSSGQYDLVLINEQFPNSLHSLYLQENLNGIVLANESNTVWFTDCRNLHDVYRKTIHKCNRKEGYKVYAKYNPISLNENTDNDIKVVTWLGRHWEMPVIMTLGEEGAIVYDENSSICHILGTHIIEQTDTVGAGDAFFSGLASGYICNLPLAQAAELGNISATVCIKKLRQTGNPTLAEVVALAADLDYRYNPELAVDIRKAKYVTGTDFELINDQISKRRKNKPPKVIIFDHDGTISTLRQGWEVVMRALMISNIIGEQRTTLSAESYHSVEQAVDKLIDQTTGVQTIIQMHEFVKLIRSFGYVNESDILEPKQYKDQYNEQLLSSIQKKKDYVQQGFLSLEDVTIKGSVPFLEYVHQQGALIFLASGTDVEDVKKEAELLGYAHYFNGGIFGSIGDIAKDPKKVVMQEILTEIRKKGDIGVEDCFVFGDGAVEIREGRKQNLFTVGLVSDEKQRFGINLMKRERLILAGADMLIPDFSMFDTLIESLGWEHE